MTANNEHLLGFAEVRAALSDRFGTSFELQNTGGNCVTLMAKLERGIELLITDRVDTLTGRVDTLKGLDTLTGNPPVER